jgi:hypothetical protein
MTGTVGTTAVPVHCEFGLLDVPWVCDPSSRPRRADVRRTPEPNATLPRRRGDRVSDWRDQEVRNESHSRDRNEWIAETRGVVALEHETDELFVCECSDPACRARITLTRIEYEAVRGYPTRFAIATDHENPEVDQLVSEGGRFTVVQKIAGAAARIARETDHRHRDAE